MCVDTSLCITLNCTPKCEQNENENRKNYNKTTTTEKTYFNHAGTI